jgi:putative DNA primase/helicase
VITGTDPEILTHLEGVRRTANGWQSRCPAHDDTNGSLCISIGDDGRTLAYCQAGCTFDAICRAAGVEKSSLAPKQLSENDSSNGSRIVATYNYQDADGELLYQVVRKEPKAFLQRTPKAGGVWEWKLNGVQRVLYRLPQLQSAPTEATVFVFEGESDADNAASRGLVATTSVGGASKPGAKSKWRPEYSQSLKGRHVVIVPDNDAAGRAHAEAAAKSLSGVAASVKILELPGLPPKGDVSDWFNAGGTVEEFAKLANFASEWAVGQNDSQVTDAVSSTDIRTLEGRNDTANGRRLAEMHGQNVRWCEPLASWLCWDGKRWRIDADRTIERLAKMVPDALWSEVAEASGAVELARFVAATANYRGLQNMIAAAKSEPGIAVQAQDLDAQAWLLNVRNGTLDLKTGQLREPSRQDYLTKLLPHDFINGPDIECPLFDEFLWKVCAENSDLIQFLRRLFGMALVGQAIEQVLPIFWGKGANGKSVLIETMLHVFGDDYGYKAAPDLLVAKKNEAHPAERAELHGRRFVACVETEESRRLSESMVKELTGTDSITARQFYQKFFTFRPSHTVFLVTNHRPVVKGTDAGIWRRPKLVPFTVTIPEAEQDRYLGDKLKAEASGILAWAVRGCLEWQQEGLGEPESVKAATAEYRASQDTLGAFFGEVCLFGPEYTAKASDVRKAYETWCEQNGERPVSGRKMGEVLTERNVERYRSGGIWYRNLGLAD